MACRYSFANHEALNKAVCACSECLVNANTVRLSLRLARRMAQPPQSFSFSPRKARQPSPLVPRIHDAGRNARRFSLPLTVRLPQALSLSMSTTPSPKRLANKFCTSLCAFMTNIDLPVEIGNGDISGDTAGKNIDSGNLVA